MSTTAAISPANANIRAASHGDAAAVFALVNQLSDRYDVDRAAFDIAFAEAVDGGDRSVLLIADVDGHVAGYALMTVARLIYTRQDAAQIQELIVDAAWGRRGIGSSLVAAVEDICRGRGISELIVASRRAPAFYDRLDYRSTADYLKKVFNTEH
ncbi:GNAT family N-acetyltransferase [Salinibacterium hongtaonis]|uniref:GNAT family N-acetyltransferase n=1 Tax=Homoserinimonas hongtaonis TaxID=2079791 RepID=A0A2U1SY71_9MICO|nr:GNAT family N-acetyltransferase [Salinibacterium hongtaonis]PWB96581.1 GNAT family N-acetyltransferase [Salinibacterium hongtaonis]